MTPPGGLGIPPGSSIVNTAIMANRFVLIGELRRFLDNHPDYVVTDVTRPELDLTEPVTAHNEWGDGTASAPATITLS